MDEGSVILLIICTIGFVIYLAYYFSQGGNNSDCDNCGRKLVFGEHKDYSYLNTDNERKNLCSKCYKKLEKLSHKGKYW